MTDFASGYTSADFPFENARLDEHGREVDAETYARRTMSPAAYRNAAEAVDLCMELDYRIGQRGPCDCDEGSHCPAHGRVTQVVDRYQRMRARARQNRT